MTREEYVGLGAAVVLHVALGAFLVLHDSTPSMRAPPERIDVSLATEVSLESTAPDPSAEPAAAYAPTLADVPAPEPAEPEVARPVERTVQPPVEEPAPRPTARPTQRPTATPTTRPTSRPNQRPTSQPTARPTSRATSTPAPTPSTRPTSGGSRIGDDFLDGSSASTGTRGSPAAAFGQTERAALSSAITRALRPNWTAPSGVDAEQLVTVVGWKLNRDGTLNGQPRCIGQRGITDSNRPQAQLHCERAIRAVQLADFSSLPEQFYSRWNDLEWEFDRRL
ncbi:energy transducer TonB [Aurantiacibacter flavus]|uniref:energy transducer TonB n=1 Tax=Aurantiacibacter flavus TaxID=3145232 RepID=UPI0032177ECB